MVKDLLPREVDANSAPPDFWARYHAFRRARQVESRPDDPLVPDEIEEARMRRPRDFEIVHRYEISRDGEMLSWFGCGTAAPSAPGYEKNRHLMGASWAVAAGHRRKGIGSMWLPIALRLMERHGCTLLTLGSEEESGHAFLRTVGAQPKLTDRESRLQLDGVDWDMVARWAAEGAARNPDTTLEIVDGRMPESEWEDYSKQASRLLNLVPTEDLDIGEIVITPPVLAEWYDAIDRAGESLHTVITREPDGTISAMTDVKWAAHTPAVVHQQFTGVDPSARGRGLGKWTKATMLQHVRRLHPEARYVSTWNAASNAAMLGINNALGFRLHRMSTEYQITRDDLAAKVRSLEAR
ncbi:MAG TPA: GNAT family N-acetyltransferase [Candidatus Dormibacteraeota bacterium]|nr:GNAT family N-acetyltransferase [Candidatus Dormibacteraeota bacterium]